MRTLMLSAVLAIAATDAGPAAAQEIVSGGSPAYPGYYVPPIAYGGNYTPVYRANSTYSSGSRSYPGYSFPGSSYPGSSRGDRYGGPANYRSYGGVSYGGRSYGGRSFDSGRR